MLRKIAFIALLIGCISGAAFAQETTPQFCGTLSQDDCAILTQSQQAMAALDSASFDAKIDIAVTNIPNVKAPVTIAITGSGSYSGLNKLRTDMTAATTNTSQLLVALLTDLNADVTITIDLPPETQEMLGVAISDSHLTFQERLVDGIGYLNMDTLQTLMRNSALKGWYGLDLANFVASAIRQNPDMFNNSMSGMNTGSMQDYQGMFSDSAFINRFLQIERTDDRSRSSATFDITLNMGALMGSHEFQMLMREQMQRQNASMTDAEIDQALTISSQMFKGMDITLSENIDTEDGYLHSIKGSFLFDASGMMATMSESGSDSTAAMPAPQISLDFTYSYSDFNSAPAISAPPNAVIIPYQSLLRPSVST
ncbi:MAG: hypothetical protein ABI700_34580 [Chloroflexota bacterium]